MAMTPPPFARMVIPGVPRLNPKIDRLMNEMPKPKTPEESIRLPVRSPADVVDGLGLERSVRQAIEQLVEQQIQTAHNELVLRRNLMDDMMYSEIPRNLRSVVLRRAVELLHVRLDKAMVPEVWTPDQIQKSARGGRYFKRVTKEGRHRYYYDAKRYQRREGEHVAGDHAAGEYIKSKVLKQAERGGPEGCAIEELGDLVKRHGADAVHRAIKGMEGQICYKGRRLFLKSSLPKFIAVPNGTGSLEKAEGYPIGTIRQWRGGRYQKKAPGKWIPVGHEAGKRVTTRSISTMKEPIPLPRTTPGERWKSGVPPGMTPAAPHGDPKAELAGQRGGTEAMHWDKKRNAYTRERIKLHDTIVKAFLKDSKPVSPDETPVAIVMMGGTASGKSTIRKKAYGIGNAAIMDADEIKTKLPEYRKAVRLRYDGAATMSHEESSMLAKRVKNEAVATRRNVVIDGTGANAEKYLDEIRKLKAAGYHVALVMPDVDVEDALARANVRAEKTGWRVMPEFVRDAYAKIPGNFFKIAAEVDEAKLYNNRVDGGKLVWEKNRDGHEIHHDPEFVKKFTNSSKGST